MSFSVRDENHQIDLSNVDDKRSDIVTNYIRGYNDKLERDVSNDFLFDIEELSDDEFNIKYKVVNTDGPVVSFLGFYIDLSSGYIVMGYEKSNEFIAIENWYHYLNKELEIYPNPLLIQHAVERFKVGDIGIGKFERLINDNPFGSDSEKSKISRLLNSDSGSKRKGEGIFNFVDDAVLHFESMAEYLYTIKDIISYRTDRDIRDTYVSLENQSPGVANFLSSFINMANYGSIAENVLSEIYRSYRLRRNIDGGNELVMALSSGVFQVNSELFQTSMNSGDIRSMTKTDALIMNLRDIVETYEDTSILGDFDDLTLRAGKASKEEVYEVIDKIGVDEYLSGRELGSVTRGFRRNESGEYIRRLTSRVIPAIEETLVSYTYDINDLVAVFKKSVRFYKDALSYVDKVMR